MCNLNIYTAANESHSTDGVPPDGTPQKTIHTFQLGLVIVYYLLAVAGIVFTVVCLLFNFAFRKRRLDVRYTVRDFMMIIFKHHIYQVLIPLVFYTNEGHAALHKLKNNFNQFDVHCMLAK